MPSWMTSQWLANRTPAVRQPIPDEAVNLEIEELHLPFMQYLKDKGLPYIRARSDIPSGIAKGAHDFTVFCPKRAVVIEFKSRNGKRKPDQVAWNFLMERQGWKVPLVYTLEEAKRMVEEAL